MSALALFHKPVVSAAIRFQASFCGLFLGELLAFASTAELPAWRQALLGLGAGYLLVFALGLVPAFLFAGVGLGLSRVQQNGVSWWSRVRGLLSSPDVDAGRRVSASLFAGLGLAAAGLAASYFLSLTVVLDVVRPPNQALLLAAAHFVLTLGVLASFAPLRGLVVSTLRLVARPFGGATFLDRPGRVLALLAFLLCLAAAAGLYLLRATLADVPWLTLVPPGAALAMGCLVFALAKPARSVVTGLALLGLLLAALPVTWLLRPSDYGAVVLFDEELASTAFASDLLTRLTDADGDGHRSFLGGGDCKPHDPRIHPGAADVPDDGKDQDCDGADLKIPALLGDAAPPSHPLPATVPKQPDVVLITIDAFAASHLKAFGYRHETMPNLEKLFRRGVLFEHCFAQGPSTRLSFPALFTSRYDSEIESVLEGRFPYPMSSSNHTLAEAFKSLGYRTTAVVPSSYFSPSRWRGLTQGFDLVDTSAVTAASSPFNAEQVVKAAIAQLRKGKGGSDLFMWLHLFDPHSPHAVPPGETARSRSREDVYDSELHYLDRHLGTLLAAIERDLGPDTLIVLTGDHGHGFAGKRYAKGAYGYDLNTVTLHVPTLFVGASLPAARRSSLCSTLDIMPTVLDLLRAPLRRGMRGFSLVPELFSGRVARPQVLFHEQFLPEKLWRDGDPLALVSVRTPDYNYVQNRVTGSASLWKWSADYHEQKDLLRLGGPDPNVRAQLSSLLSAFVYRSLKDHAVKKVKGSGADDRPPQPDEP